MVNKGQLKKGAWTPLRGFKVLDSGFFVSGTWIPKFNHRRDADLLGCIPDSNVQDSRSTNKVFLDSGIPGAESGFPYMGAKSEVPPSVFVKGSKKLLRGDCYAG